jgi:tRNA pseudouridine32 synthase/23S rRNA pseudouridine746 synthase
MSRPLPIHNGISPSAVFLPGGGWPTVLAFLVERFPEVGAERWAARMTAGRVLDADGACMQPDTPYRPSTHVFYYRELEQEARIPFEEVILFENDHLIVADKPHFLPTAPVGQYLQETLLIRLKRRLGIDHLVPLHRLDRETAGVVLLSKSVQTRDAYHALFRGDGITKTYEALARFNPDHAYPVTRRSRIERALQFYRREEVAGTPNAVSIINLMAQQGEWARYQLQPVTGKHINCACTWPL